MFELTQCITKSNGFLWKLQIQKSEFQLSVNPIIQDLRNSIRGFESSILQSGSKNQKYVRDLPVDQCQLEAVELTLKEYMLGFGQNSTIML
jgi:hypothetical protein